MRFQRNVTLWLGGMEARRCGARCQHEGRRQRMELIGAGSSTHNLPAGQRHMKLLHRPGEQRSRQHLDAAGDGARRIAAEDGA